MGKFSEWKDRLSTSLSERMDKRPLPKKFNLILGNLIYIEKKDLSPVIRNRLIHIAAFQNPEFYKAQAMRLSTYGKSRVISCAEDFPNHIGLPRGCLEEILEMSHRLGIKVSLRDERDAGAPINVNFCGTLNLEQEEAMKALLEHNRI